MPRKSKKRKNKVQARTEPTSEQSVVELVSDLALMNNNVSSFVTDDEILLESSLDLLLQSLVLVGGDRDPASHIQVQAGKRRDVEF